MDLTKWEPTRFTSINAISVSNAMSNEVQCCKPDDTVATAETFMREKKIRRLPVTEHDGRLVGILAINDIAQEAARRTRMNYDEYDPCPTVGNDVY